MCAIVWSTRLRWGLYTPIVGAQCHEPTDISPRMSGGHAPHPGAQWRTCFVDSNGVKIDGFLCALSLSSWEPPVQHRKPHSFALYPLRRPSSFPLVYRISENTFVSSIDSHSFLKMKTYMKWAALTLAAAQLGAAQTSTSCNPTKSSSRSSISRIHALSYFQLT